MSDTNVHFIHPIDLTKLVAETSRSEKPKVQMNISGEIVTFEMQLFDPAVASFTAHLVDFPEGGTFAHGVQQIKAGGYEGIVIVTLTEVTEESAVIDFSYS